MALVWGVRYPPGHVCRAYDMTSAFLDEKRYLSRGAQACVSRDGGVTWSLVPWGSMVRPAPAPPRRPTPLGSRGPGVGGFREGVFFRLWRRLRGPSVPRQAQFRRNRGQ